MLTKEIPDIASLLEKHFGYNEFRPLQDEIIRNVLKKEDSLVLMPTGGGKSLCFQLPALCLEGMTIVVSPLIALMKDQVDALKANGISAEFINSSLSQKERDEIRWRTRNGEVKLLYIAPERISLPFFQDFLRSLRVDLVAIDEAHCISEWGHDFRPDYRNLKILKTIFPKAPLIALTATATQKVREDIVNQLDLNKAKIFIGSFNRKNLNYHIVPKKNTFLSIVELLEKHSGQSAIIYCFSRKDTEALAYDLQQEGIKILPYHAGLNQETRRKTQEKFIRDEIQVITATIAFGMGIDKPDVRLVVHYSMPKNMEGYYQETGRAGRDGLPSTCVLYYTYADKIKQDYFIDRMSDPREQANMQNKLQKIVDFCDMHVCRRKTLLEYFGESLDQENCQSCDVCLDPREEFNATQITQKILSAVIRTGERFGMQYVCDVLRGSKNKKILERGHNELSIYGITKDFSDAELKEITKMLILKKFLYKTEDSYPVIKTTPDGRRFIYNRDTISLVVPKKKSEVKKSKTKSVLDYDDKLFELLRGLRKEMAAERNVPPFVIFGDASLHEMAYYYPQSLLSFSRILGVGEQKQKTFAEPFLKIIRDYCDQHGIEEKPISGKEKKGKKDRMRTIKNKESTFAKTKRLIEQKLSIEEVAEKRSLSIPTVLNHLERLKEAGMELDYEHLKPSEESYQIICEAFSQTGGTALLPVHKHLDKYYSYDEIRLVRLFL